MEDAIALANFSGVQMMDPLLLGDGSACALCMGDISRVDQYLDKMLESLATKPSACAEAFYNALKAWRCLLEKNFSRASSHADLAIKFGIAMGGPFMMPYAYLVKAIVMHELHDDAEAYVHISEVWKICNTIRIYQAEFMTLLLEARIAFDSGDETSGANLLRRAMALGKEHGYVNGYFWVNSTIAKLCVKALEHDIQIDYVQNLIRRRNLTPDAHDLHLENWPWPLRIKTLGQFEIIRDSEAVRFTGKVQQKPLLLLKALIAFGGREVREEQCDALWPDAQGDLAHRSFEITLYRLRRLLGSNKAIHLSESKLSLDTKSCWVDIFALEQILNEAEMLWETSDPSQATPHLFGDGVTRAIQLTQKAIAIYKGDFLVSEPDQPWLLSTREKMRAKHLRGIRNLALYWELAGEPERAIGYYEKALEVDDVAENLYQRLIICHQQLDRQSHALAVYKRCKSTLDAKLGIEPSASTKALLNTAPSRK